jgi:hypothetical protein
MGGTSVRGHLRAHFDFIILVTSSRHPPGANSITFGGDILSSWGELCPAQIPYTDKHALCIRVQIRVVRHIKQENLSTKDTKKH